MFLFAVVVVCAALFFFCSETFPQSGSQPASASDLKVIFIFLIFIPLKSIKKEEREINTIFRIHDPHET